MKAEQTIQKQLAENPIILYMKGIPDNPECGFSAKAVNLLKQLNIPFSYVNVLQAPFIREKLPKISQWPTYPQLFVKAELVGGADIIEEMFNNGSLESLLKSVVPEKSDDNSLTAEEVKNLIWQKVPQAQIFVEGTGCDLTVTVISDQFADLTLVKKQQRVLESLTEPLSNGRLHAVSVKAYTETEWQALKANQNSGLLQIKI